MKREHIIGIILLIIAVVIIFIILTSVNYERIEITPNGTSIEVPYNQTQFDGKFESAKIWHWDKGVLVTYNSYEDNNLIKISELGFDTVNNLIKNGEKQDIDGYTCYVINADDLFKIQLFDIIKISYNGKFYCIPLANETTHDNILICCNDQNMAVHMAQSVQYKNVFLHPAGFNDTTSTIENMTGYLKSKANDYANNTNLSEVKSTVEEKTGINLDDVKTSIDNLMEG